MSPKSAAADGPLQWCSKMVPALASLLRPLPSTARLRALAIQYIGDRVAALPELHRATLTQSWHVARVKIRALD
jgi:hypothetical protein